MKTVSAPAAAPALQPPAVALRLMTDERLARWAANGSQAAFAVIFERHHQALHRYCQSILGNAHDAADALQSTMLKALRALPGETRTITLKPWLYRIAHNESISLLRSRRSDSELDAAAHVGDRGSESILESRERLRELAGDLQELSEQQRGALLMRELGGLEFKDVADAFAVTATAAKQSVYEARSALQALQEGRAMDCDLVRRALSDGDRRTLRNMKLRGHLRACAGCRDFEAALRHRPAHLAALAPPLPLAAAASILHGLLGAGTGAGHGGGGLLAGLGAGAKTSGAFSLGAAKVATVAVIAGSAAGGGIYVAPDRAGQRLDNAPVTRDDASAGDRVVSVSATRDRDNSSAVRQPQPSDSSSIASQADSARTVDAAVAGGQAQRPGVAAVPQTPASAMPQQDTAGAAPASRSGDVVARADADGDRRGERPTQTVPAPAAATPAPARTAPAPGGPPAATSAPAASSARAPASAGVVAAPAAPAADLADAVAPSRRR